MSTSNVLPPRISSLFLFIHAEPYEASDSPRLSTLCPVVGNTSCAAVNAVARARRTVLAFVFCLMALSVGALCPAAHAQAGQWDWVAPSNPTANTYSFGTVGVADPANYPPGRWSASSWTDSTGKFWMFGGALGSLPTNDLWQYDPSTGLWTCMSGAWAYDSNYGTLRPLPASFGTLGVPAASNLPPGRLGAATWIDSSGKLWLFGGSSNSTTGYEYNDLWVFDPSTKYWTWMGGGQTYRQQGVYGTLGTSNANNIPSSRQRPAVWTDSNGNVWLYGGFGQGYTAAGAATQGYLNDLWELNTTTLQWTWMGGGNVVNKVGTFGAQGSATAGSTPGGLAYTAYWIDCSGNFWLFGGAGYAKTSGGYAQDDLWKYSPSTNQWTWVYGDGAPSKATVYGSMGTEASANHLGGRSYSSGWSDGAGNFWLFGGYGTGTTTTLAPRDDLWRFNPSTGYWTWMAGTQTSYNPVVYNTQDVANATNDPGARGDVVTWVDSSGNIWLYGGSPNPYSPTTGYFSDLWQYQFSAAADQPVFNPNGGINPITQTISITSSTPNATIYYTIDGSTPTVHSTLYTGPITGSQPEETIKAIAVASGYSYSPVASATFYWPLAAAPVISPVSGSYPAPLSVIITDTTPNATIYYTTDGSTPTTSSAVYPGPISVNPPITISAIATATDYNSSAVATATYALPVVATPVISPASGSYPTPLSSISITDTTPGATIYYTTDGSTPTTSSPVYYGSFSIAYSATIQATAAESGYTTSGTAKAVYTVIQATPAISSVSPLTFTPNSAFTVTVTGSNFIPTSVVYWRSTTPLTTQYVSSTQLTAQVPASLTNIDPSVTNPFGLIVKTPDAASASNGVVIAAVSANSALMPITVTAATNTVTAGSSVAFNVAVGSGMSLGSGGVGFSNLPTGATQQWTLAPYSTSSGTLTVTTTSATPKGTYTILLICTGTVPVTSNAGFLLPPLLLPLLLWRKKLAVKSTWLTFSVGLILLLSALSFIGCGTGPKYQFTTTSTTTAVNATTVTLTVQ